MTAAVPTGLPLTDAPVVAPVGADPSGAPPAAAGAGPATPPEIDEPRPSPISSILSRDPIRGDHLRWRPPLLLAAGDVVAAAVAAAAAVGGTPSLPVLGLLVVAWLLLLSADHCYDRHVASRLDQARRVVRCGTVLVAAAATGAVVLEPHLRPRQLILLAVTATAISGAQRLVGGHWGRRAHERIPVVLAGHRRELSRVMTELGRSRGHRYRVAGVCVPTRSGRQLGVPETCGFERLPTVAVQHGARAVIVVPCRHLDPMSLRRLGWQLEGSGTSLMVASGLFDVAATRARIGYAGDLPLLHVRHAELTGARRLIEAAVERVVAAVALLLLAPVLVLLALAVRLDSPGPALFRQTRVGRNGHPFSMVKLRSMVADAETRRASVEELNQSDGVLFKVRTDPRVTRVGAVLRRYSLDELPQLWNVVRGEMSLVGPRPPLPEEVERYDADTRRRLAVRPGITGLWQVSGRSDLSWDDTVRLDLRYVDNWSLGLDLRILCRTVRAVLRHDGAY